MPIDDLRILLVAIAFGGLFGWGLGRLGRDRTALTWAAGLATGIGVAAWVVALIAADPSPEWGIAGVSLASGGAAFLIGLAATRRRPG